MILYSIFIYVNYYSMLYENINKNTEDSPTNLANLSSLLPLKRVRKGAYMLATINYKDFILLGGEKLFPDKNIYFIPKEYDGLPTGESCALVGIGRDHLFDLFINPPNPSLLLKEFREHKALQYIPGITELSPYNLDIIKNIKSYSTNYIDVEDLLLLNIEPSGTTDVSRALYPNANLCLPGGGIEKQDQDSFEKCSLREFKEETNIDLKKYRKLFKHRVIAKNRDNMFFAIKIEST
jgi:hypothetical protein